MAAFNTNGWVKGKVQYPLTPWPSTPTSLDGIYVRNEFSGYQFFSGRDAPGNDIVHKPELLNDLPQLVNQCQNLSNSSGFNTNGWFKHTTNAASLKQVPSFKEGQGLYIRTEWPDFVYLPGLDSPGNDISRIRGKQVRELIEAARKNPDVVAFNTTGWMKREVVDTPVEVVGNPAYGGVYLKFTSFPEVGTVTSASKGDPYTLDLSLFALKGTAIIWGYWPRLDATVRLGYQKAVASVCQELRDAVKAGSLSVPDAAQEANSIRVQLLLSIRQPTTPFGLLVTPAVKPAGGSYQYYLETNSQRIYGKSYAFLTRGEAVKVS